MGREVPYRLVTLMVEIDQIFRQPTATHRLDELVEIVELVSEDLNWILQLQGFQVFLIQIGDYVVHYLIEIQHADSCQTGVFDHMNSELEMCARFFGVCERCDLPQNPVLGHCSPYNASKTRF